MESFTVVIRECIFIWECARYASDVTLGQSSGEGTWLLVWKGLREEARAVHHERCDVKVFRFILCHELFHKMCRVLWRITSRFGVALLEVHFGDLF